MDILVGGNSASGMYITIFHWVIFGDGGPKTTNRFAPNYHVLGPSTNTYATTLDNLHAFLGATLSDRHKFTYLQATKTDHGNWSLHL